MSILYSNKIFIDILIFKLLALSYDINHTIYINPNYNVINKLYPLHK